MNMKKSNLQELYMKPPSQYQDKKEARRAYFSLIIEELLVMHLNTFISKYDDLCFLYSHFYIKYKRNFFLSIFSILR